eukprot:TRINITY_DN19066_c0_g1_i1.p1 TRINITY_DN19066_c0_g1~~TRINITY_DN19066_c0_g1_i1.p1  ORF type:complete len:313 (+),score=54.96 TRINITY_DN19066_c0_g1_i1:3-941(+)
MSLPPVSVDTGHADMIHDAQLDYYGKRLATASSDRTVRIFAVTDSGSELQAELKGHDGPVWQACWAHPRFGTVLASCGYDKKVIIWKEEQPGSWSIVHEYTDHESSVNSIAWSPHEFGLNLACGSSDNHVSVLRFKTESSTWEAFKKHAHGIGVNSVSWAPVSSSTQVQKRFASGGCDKLIKIWRFDDQSGSWLEEHALSGHGDWVRDVAWAPNLGVPTNTIASCSQDGTIMIWTQEERGQWHSTVLHKFSNEPVWRLSWSLAGQILAVSSGDNHVTLWKETLDGKWIQLSSVAEGDPSVQTIRAAPTAAVH